MEQVAVIRVGTQVVVRLGGDIDDSQRERLQTALDEIADLVLTRVVIDCSGADRISGAGLRFLGTATTRWQVRLLDAPRDWRRSLDGLPEP